MVKFLKGFELCHEISNVIKEAQDVLVIISPFIKLHDNYKSELKERIKDDKLKIVLVFGKNEQDKSRCLTEDDWEFFKSFPSIEIRYEKRLHAKIYANDFEAMITSMNLYDFSQDHNIEAGICFDMEKGLLSSIASSLGGVESFESQVENFIKTTIDQAKIVFKRVPKYNEGFLGRKKYIKSETDEDHIYDFIHNLSQFDSKEKNDKKQSKENNSSRNVKNIDEPHYGYCIRTGVKIPFNINMPMCEEAYRSWSKFGNGDYPEKYCHFSGEPSYGETSFAYPILSKNWNKAKKIFNL